MKKVFHFDSPTAKYKADACVVSCFDARFELATRKFLKKRRIWQADPLKVAGEEKSLPLRPKSPARVRNGTGANLHAIA